MTPLFVTPYPDELAYSILARVYQRSGYISGTFFRRQVLKNPKAHPDVAFLNGFKKEIALAILGKSASFFVHSTFSQLVQVRFF